MAGIQECENCHAPLPLGPPGAVVECTYCRAQNRVAGMTGVMPAAQPYSPYGAPQSPYGAPPSPYGSPSPHIQLAPPVRSPGGQGAIVVGIVAVGFIATCGMGMAMWMLMSVR
jgi:hypothetical protein